MSLATRFAERKRVVRDDEEKDSKPSPQQQQQQQRVQQRPQKVFRFAETTESILAKYASEPPSLELHIHPTHYRFGNQDGVLPKNSPTMKQFFEYMYHEAIPPAATEIFRDSGVRFYEGCIIIKIIDHRNAGSGNEQQTERSSSAAAANGKTDGVNGTNGADVVADESDIKKAPEPVSYSTLLRPTPLSLWHDLLYTTDTSHGRFSDQLAISMESEILTLTVRTLDLRTPVKEPSFVKNKKSKIDTVAPGSVSRKEIKDLFEHRPTVPRKRRGLHEDAEQHANEYEELMLFMDERQNNNPATNVANQFARLDVIEQVRRKQERIRMLQQQQQQQQQHQQQQPQQPQANQSPGIPNTRTPAAVTVQPVNHQGHPLATAGGPQQYTREQIAQIQQRQQQQARAVAAAQRAAAQQQANARQQQAVNVLQQRQQAAEQAQQRQMMQQLQMQMGGSPIHNAYGMQAQGVMDMSGSPRMGSPAGRPGMGTANKTIPGQGNTVPNHGLPPGYQMRVPPNQRPKPGGR